MGRCMDILFGGQLYACKFYPLIHEHIKVRSVYKWIWKSCYIMKTKMFSWLLLLNRVNTRDSLQRQHWHVTDDTHYELCPRRNYENRTHLFFDCTVSTHIGTIYKFHVYLMIASWQLLLQLSGALETPFSWRS
jgi:hypothetical protein